MSKSIPSILSIVALLVFAISLSQPAFSCSTESFIGYEVLAIGWAGLLGADPRWFANLGFLTLLYRTMFQSRKALVALFFTAPLALLSFLPAAGCAAPGGAPGVSTGLALGGYLWVVALTVACLANWLVPEKPTEVPTQPEEAEHG